MALWYSGGSHVLLPRIPLTSVRLLQIDAYVTLEPGARFVLKAVLSASYTWQKTFNLIGPFTLFTVTIPLGFIVIPIPVKLRIDAEVSRRSGKLTQPSTVSSLASLAVHCVYHWQRLNAASSHFPLVFCRHR